MFNESHFVEIFVNDFNFYVRIVIVINRLQKI